jgi:hypothetical protein
MNREEIFEKIKAGYSSEDLDDHVHELKDAEASAINNTGMDAQLAYLEKQAGLDWLELTFIDKESS